MWSKFAEVRCAFAVAEVRKVTTNLSQTCGFAVAELSVNLRCSSLLNILYYYVQLCIASSNNNNFDTKIHFFTEIVLQQ